MTIDGISELTLCKKQVLESKGYKFTQQGNLWFVQRPDGKTLSYDPMCGEADPFSNSSIFVMIGTTLYAIEHERYWR